MKKRKRFAVIGDPVGHSISPFLHNNIIANGGFDAEYEAVRVTPQGLGDFCREAAGNGFAGFNVTMPHKQAIMDILDEADSYAAGCGAVNTVKVLDDGRLKGFNTDVKGLFAAMGDRGAGAGGAGVMIIGAGGAAGAIAQGCTDEGAAWISIFNRTYERAAALCAKISNRSVRISAHGLEKESMKKAADAADIIINCTPAGMKGVEGGFGDFSFLDGSDAFLCDLVYNPWETELIAYGKKKGLETMNGMGMLIYQGILAFEIFMDTELDRRAEYERLLPLCRQQIENRD